MAYLDAIRDAEFLLVRGEEESSSCIVFVPSYRSRIGIVLLNVAVQGVLM